MAEVEKKAIVVGADNSEESVYALQWTLDCLLAPLNGSQQFRIVLVHCRPTAASVLPIAGPGAADVLPMVEADLKKIGLGALEHAKSICQSRDMNDTTAEMVEGDARIGLCDAVAKHGASILVVGSRGYGPIKRAFLGSVSDYCARNAKCTVMIVKKPKP